MANQFRVPNNATHSEATGWPWLDWLIYPGVIFWDKLDDGWISPGTHDSDETYVETEDSDQWAKFFFENFTLPIGYSSAYIKMYVIAKKTSETCNIRLAIIFGEGAGYYGEWQALTDNYETYVLECHISPLTGLELTSDEANLGWFGSINVDNKGARITAVWFEAGIFSPRRTAPIKDIITLEAIRQMEMAGHGSFYVNELGLAVYRSRFARSGWPY